jgi:hypothetical protein
VPGKETLMIEGGLIAESLRVGTNLENLMLTVRKISRFRPGDTTADQPDIWTLLEFEADEAEADQLARAFATVLDDQPTWYVNFQSPTTSFVVFPGRIFRYPRGDKAGRADAEAYGRQLAIPESQLDWTV